MLLNLINLRKTLKIRDHQSMIAGAKALKGKEGKKTEWQVQSKSRRGGEEKKRISRLGNAAETSGELAEWLRLQRKNLNILDLPKRKGWSQSHKVNSW